MNGITTLLLYCLPTSGRVQGRRVTDAAAPRRNVGAGPGRGAAVTCQGLVDTQLQQPLPTMHGENGRWRGIIEYLWYRD